MDKIIHNGGKPSTTKRESSPASNNEPATEADCPICREPLKVYAKVKPCGHIFDLKCIETWIDTVIGEKTFPCCRSEIRAIEQRGNKGCLSTTEIPAPNLHEGLFFEAFMYNFVQHRTLEGVLLPDVAWLRSRYRQLMAEWTHEDTMPDAFQVYPGSNWIVLQGGLNYQEQNRRRVDET
ncbi:hypothetical protein N431DRAFT_442219 [Stipitochalara longipes BDJ]|nr:hypothetical protein N431DRAFT_442219 [Stipitochalara longipes BDJ]